MKAIPKGYEKDTELWEAFKAGDQKAFLKLYDDNYSTLFNYGCKISGDTYLTDDCIQDIFLELWRNRKKVNPVFNIKPYLLKYLKRKILAEITSQQKNVEFEYFAITIPTNESHESWLIKNELSVERHNKLNAAINGLTGRQKEILHLKFYENMSYEEIAEVTSLKMSRVYNLIYEALKALKSYLLITIPLFMILEGLTITL